MRNTSKEFFLFVASYTGILVWDGGECVSAWVWGCVREQDAGGRMQGRVGEKKGRL